MAINRKTIRIENLQKMIKDLLKMTTKYMNSEIKMGLLGDKYFDWKSGLLNDMRRKQPGESFIQTAIENRKSLLIEFLQNEISASAFVHHATSGKASWKKDGVEIWLRKCRRLLEMLLTSCHLLGGQPARATELSTMRWAQSVAEERGAYWSYDRLLLLTIYSKTRSITGKDRLVPRYLEKELSMLVAEYFAIVRPVEIMFCQELGFKGGADLKEFMWADYNKGRWNSNYISDVFTAITTRHGLSNLGFSEYRHVAIAFMEKHLKHQAKSVLMDSIFDLQAGHSSSIAGSQYAISDKDHSKVSKDALHNYFLASKEWQELLLNKSDMKTLSVMTLMNFRLMFSIQNLFLHQSRK